jgi:hypothetical protein
MLRYMKRLLIVTALTLVLAAGCTDRGPNVPDRPVSEGRIMEGLDHDFFQELFLQIGRNASREGPRVPLQIKMYAPEGSIPWIPGGQVKPVPLLVLLPPQDGKAYYFFDHGLKQLANELIAEGAIKPMAIACIENDPIFGGYFYAGHSAPAGNYDTLIGGTLLEQLFYVGSIEGILSDSLPVGIGGVGMGGYGAFRAALFHEGVFTSVSTTDGPLDFDGPNGNGGFIEVFENALLEQGLLRDPEWRTKFDSSGAWHLSRLFIGGALAFSPNDTLIDTTGIYQKTSDSTYRMNSIPASQRDTINDTMTLITGIVKPDQFNFDFHLPFDNAGKPYSPIWNMWLENNLEQIMINGPSPGSQLRGVKIWIGTSSEFEFGNYRQQTLSWIDWLHHSALDPQQLEVKEYSGYPGNPATSDQYIYDLMRDMLIFHSKAFEEN